MSFISFHSAKSSDVLELKTLLRLLDVLREHGAEKVNFAGGEPFLYPELLGALVRHAKAVSRYPSVSVISNGALISRGWFERHGAHLDFLGVSCDSADARTNVRHGRAPAGAAKARDPAIDVRRAAALAREFGVRFKVNSVVTNLNKDETGLAALVNETAPERWKIFEVLAVEGENVAPGGGSGGGGGGAGGGDGGGGCGSPLPSAAPSSPPPPLAVRNAPMAVPFSDLPVSNADFWRFVERNRERLRPELRDRGIVKAEDNATMRASYVLIDEYGRFLDASRGAKTPSRPILNGAGGVDVDAAARDLLGGDGRGFDRKAFIRRDGYYPDEWSRRSS